MYFLLACAMFSVEKDWEKEHFPNLAAVSALAS